MKRLNRDSRHAIRSVVAVSMVIAMAFVMGPAVSADPEIPYEPLPAIASDFTLAADDGGAWEVGAEAAGGDLSAYACSEATYLRNRLTSRGWVSRFLWCGSNAWEEDYKRAAAPGGGNEHNMLDQVDLMFYVGHGSPSSFTFDSLKDDYWLTPSDCQYSWGDGDNEWVGLTSCQVLADSNRSAWASCMKGTHQILGFITNAAARTGTATQGYNWAYYITNNWTVTGAWFKACDVSQPAGRKVRVLAPAVNCYNDRPHSSYVGCPDTPVGSTYWYWDHTCGSEMPTPMDVSSIAAMPMFKTPPLSLSEAQAEYRYLGNVFNLPAVPPTNASAAAGDVELWSVQQDDFELEMERNSGLFTYFDMNLWSGNSAQAALAANAVTISADDAKTIADRFLKENDLLPGDARWYETTSDTLTGITDQPGAAGIKTTADTVYQVIYSRVLSATVLNAAGVAQEQEFLVVGPGAKLKVYVPTNASLAAAAGQDELPVSGVQGGWRSVEQVVSASGVAATIPILSEAQIRKAYEQVEPFVVLNTPPIDADGREVVNSTLAYWEEGNSNVQSQLIPTYGLWVKYTKGGELLNYDWAYVPANPSYMRPYAKILQGPTAPVKVGSNVTLTAADASKTLAELGYDPILNFSLGSEPYLYEWFVDSISDANKLGGGVSPSITFRVRPSPDMKDGMSKQTIILRVTDFSDDLRSSVDTYSLDIFPRVTMPLNLKR